MIYTDIFQGALVWPWPVIKDAFAYTPLPLQRLRLSDFNFQSCICIRTISISYCYWCGGPRSDFDAVYSRSSTSPPAKLIFVKIFNALTSTWSLGLSSTYTHQVILPMTSEQECSKSDHERHHEIYRQWSTDSSFLLIH